MLNIFKTFKEHRVKPNHEISQWYMKTSQLKKQVNFLFKNITCKNMLFLGDGDGVAILLTLMLQQKKAFNIQNIYVFDIDERELNLYNNLYQKFCDNKNVTFKTVRYNIFDAPPKKFINYFDCFYINPPYSTTTTPKGLGFNLWLERCVEMSTKDAKGIIVYPVKDIKSEITEVKENIFNFIKERQFNILPSPVFKHSYYDTKCKSKNLIVQKTNKTYSNYTGKPIPVKIATSLYHNNIIPHYVIDDGSEYGKYVQFDKNKLNKK